MIEGWPKRRGFGKTRSKPKETILSQHSFRLVFYLFNFLWRIRRPYTIYNTHALPVFTLTHVWNTHARTHTWIHSMESVVYLLHQQGSHRPKWSELNCPAQPINSGATVNIPYEVLITHNSPLCTSACLSRNVNIYSIWNRLVCYFPNLDKILTDYELTIQTENVLLMESELCGRVSPLIFAHTSSRLSSWLRQVNVFTFEGRYLFFSHIAHY